MHCSSQHHEAFENAVIAFHDWEADEPEPTVSLGGEPVTVSRLCGLMWRCSDILPSGLLDSVKDMEDRTHALGRTTYGAAAQLMKSRIA